MNGDQETQSERELKKPADWIEKIKLSNNSKIVVAGIGSHTTNINEIKEITGELERVVNESGGTNIVFLGEGSAVLAGIKQESTETAILGGDQQAIACRAKELGVETIDSWDMTLEEQLTEATKQFGAESTLLWMLSQSSIALKSQGEYISIKNILAMLDKFDLTKDEISTILNNEEVSSALNDEDGVDRFFQKHAGFSLTDVNGDDLKYKTISQVAHPENTPENTTHLPEGLRKASLVAGELSKTRDLQFKNKISQYSQQGKTIFVSCGGGHVTEFLKKIREA